jgi:hypothetical protein
MKEIPESGRLSLIVMCEQCAVSEDVLGFIAVVTHASVCRAVPDEPQLDPHCRLWTGGTSCFVFRLSNMQDAVSQPGPTANALVNVTNPCADASRGTQSKTVEKRCTFTRTDVPRRHWEIGVFTMASSLPLVRPTLMFHTRVYIPNYIYVVNAIFSSEVVGRLSRSPLTIRRVGTYLVPVQTKKPMRSRRKVIPFAGQPPPTAMGGGVDRGRRRMLSRSIPSWLVFGIRCLPANRISHSLGCILFSSEVGRLSRSPLTIRRVGTYLVPVQTKNPCGVDARLSHLLGNLPPLPWGAG